ncbi:MAG TPA: twin-arginine translocase TatA/TatE family subunit [Fimbriimonadaceae bacterium]|nr:twin-arginine translocase TatA/TatE family subunit [Fimbriimonadaceae bacterium]
MLQTFAFGLQGPELWIILVIVLILFGGKKIPELLRGVGKGVGELQKGLEEGKKSMQDTIEKERQGADPQPEIGKEKTAS